MTAPPPALRRPACVRACACGRVVGQSKGRIPPGNRGKGSTGIPRALRSKDTKFQKNILARGHVKTSSKVGCSWWGEMGRVVAWLLWGLCGQILAAVCGGCTRIMALPCTCTGTRRCRCCCGEDPLQKKKEGYSVSVGVLAFLAFVVIGSGTFRGCCCCCCCCTFVHGAWRVEKLIPKAVEGGSGSDGVGGE